MRVISALYEYTRRCEYTQATDARKSRREAVHRRGYPPEENRPRSTRKLPAGFVLKRFIVARRQLAQAIRERREQAYQLRSS